MRRCLYVEKDRIKDEDKLKEKWREEGGEGKENMNKRTGCERGRGER